ncbi:MAG: ABC transporter permease [Acidilobaceae archaeon]
MASLLKYIIVRASLLVPTILVLYTFIFIILRVLPGDPILAVIGTRYVPPEQLEALRRLAGLDKPLCEQYLGYLFNALRLDFGVTLAAPQGVPVSDYIKLKFPATLESTLYAFSVSVLIGVVTGLLASRVRGGALDNSIRLYSIVAYTIFIPWLGMILQYIFGVKLHLLPTSDRISPGVYIDGVTGLYTLDAILTGNLEAFLDSLSHLILPSLTLGIVLSGAYTRLVRNNMVDVLETDFIRSYRARGISEWKVYIYAFKHAFIPTLTFMGLQFAILLGGAILTETTFNWPGMGTFIVDRIEYRDYNSIQGAIIFFAFMVGLVSLIVDILYAIVDPRVRY